MDLLFFCAAAFLALANGANDNFKGMATLWGSGTLSYGKALFLANVMTFIGAALALAIGGALLETFSGKGVVPPDTLQNPHFALAFALGAGLCVFIATVTRFPISTTHALLGALAGAGFFFNGTDVQFSVLLDKGLIPLAISPLLAVLLTWGLWRSRHHLRHIPIKWLTESAFLSRKTDKAGDLAHILSGSAVCLARGINDTPKIASIFLLGGVMFGEHTILLFCGIGLLMVVGSVLFSHKVAHRISHEITSMSHKEGLTGNLVTAGLVLAASVFGLGVSTTHVSVGALFGIGLMNHHAHKDKIIGILLAWILTLPSAFALAYGSALIITGL
ncbi:MAG: phosphate permease [Rhodobiaceae bacterium]|nr:MAG: phosphate permease [Rhodobiaceae bacterium]